MPWFKVDDTLAMHHKVVAAGNAAMGLWVKAGSWSMQQLTDGFIPDHMIPSLGTVTQAQRLVRVRLWLRVDGGYLFHEWESRQPTKSNVERERAAWRERQRKARSEPGVTRDSRVSHGESHSESHGHVTQSRPVPSRPLTVVTNPVSQESVSREVDDDGLTRIKKVTRGNDDHARRTAAFILAKAPSDVRNPTAYVLAAINEDPAAYRYKRGNPKKGEECPTHAGQWADACAGCAADRKAEGA